MPDDPQIPDAGPPGDGDRPTHPVPFPACFDRSDRPALLSQAACLLLLGAQLDEEAVAAETASALRGEAPLVGFAPPEDVEPLRVPRVEATGERFRLERIEEEALPEGFDEARPDEVLGMVPEILPVLARVLEAEPSPATAATLIGACIHDPREVVRVAAAVAGLAILADPLRLLEVLVEELRCDDPLARELAAVGVARFAPEHRALAGLTEPRRYPGGGEPSRTSLLVHGTFARTFRWWQPGGAFHEYLRSEVRRDLYSADDRFHWSGGYSRAARALGARDLRAWVDERDLQGLDLFTHSHGGNLSMLATQNGLRVGQLVLLSCPVHRNEYLPAFDRVDDVVSIRVRLDLVILADRGGQRFRHPRIREEILPLWFNHAATHRPAVWRDHRVPELL